MPTLLLCVLVFMFLFRRRLHTIEKEEQKSEAQYLERERKASLPIKRSLNDLSFLTIPSTLPFHPDATGALLTCEQTMQSLSSKQICNLSGISNTDLKLKYGAGNLELLASYDENYTLLLRTLADWSELLFQQGFDADAITVAKYAISCGSDVRKTYAVLATIYKKQGNLQALYDLLPVAQKNSRTLDLKKVVYEVINQPELS